MTRSAVALTFTLAPMALGSGLPNALRGAEKSVTVLDWSDRHTHLGCYKDVQEDRVFSRLPLGGNMTPEVCCNSCASRGGTHCATQYGSECWCTSDVDPDYTRHGVGVCDFLCSGDSQLMCGGDHAFDVYSIPVPEAHTAANYVGCFADDANDRIFVDKLDDMSSMTPELCEAHCVADGAMTGYYAVQYGFECWCGIADATKEYSRHGEGVCDRPCAGDTAQSCGGHFAFDLFNFGDTTNEPAPVATDSPTPVATATPAPGSVGNDNPLMMELMDMHNSVRCVHESPDLVYSDTLAADADAMVKSVMGGEGCGTLNPDLNTGLGVNMHMCGTDNPSAPCFNPGDTMEEFYAGQVGGGPPSNWGSNALQVLWKPTFEMGCAVETCEKGGMYFDTVICMYSPAREIEIGEIGVNVDYQTKTFQECGYGRD